MGNKRIYELAKEWNKSSKEVVDKAQKLGIDVKNHMGAVSTQDEKKLQQAFNQPQQKKQPVQKANQKPAGQQPSNQKKTNELSNQQKNKSNRNYQDRGQGSGQVNQGKNQSTNQNKSSQTGGNNQNRQGTTQNNNQNRQGNNQGSNQNRQGTTQGSNQNRQANNQGSNQNRQGANQGGSQNRNNNNNRGKFNNNNRNRFNKKGKKGKQQTSNKPAVPPRKFRELPEVLEYTEGMNVADIAKKIHREPAEIIKKLFMLGVMVNQNQALDKDTIELLATDYGMEPQEKIQVDIADIDKFFEADEVNPEKLVSRPPVVTIMGHVDHGKTTLLDTLRHSRVTSGEAGGITQHIGAYQIDIDGKPITFLDTPGHAAFTSMRARGASITDITILVVAADDGVMPQTVEAINHAKAAGVPIIVAVNKIDKPGANPQHVMQELSEYELIPEAWGGETIFVEISAKFGQNIEELLEMILLVAEVEDLKADPTQRAIGTVIEARLDKGKGPVTTLLVQQGSLNVGDPIVVGNTYGRVRVMVNDLGRREKTAGPATPVEITGLNDVPQAGDRFVVFEDEKTARAAGEERGKRAMLEQRAATSRVTLDNLFESLKEGELKEVNVIIKADVQGSAEALAASLKKIDVEGVRVKIVHSAVGAINESDVTLAAASNAIIIGFNVRPTPQAKIQADTEEVDIRLHRIIYKAIEEIETAMKGMLDPEFEEKITGQMTVRETFKVSKVGTIAGAFVTDGYIRRDSGVRVIRDGIVIFEGQLASLKRFKDDVKEVKMGFECGAMVEKFNDLKVDDVIEGFIMEEIKVD
ncbi:translation initiation factor IF-2 [Enterococcus mundtii]|uniref:translation initiation factor IF-2 n=1 Tax=Enterococcus TaxID=1350 RepID=UPI00044FDE5D|nr:MULTISPECIES: translation initiation factor IF-2 [Enterococcus]AZP93035.1 translation initiation factor IF-2 [Enterococcus mundtii]EYT96393.1 translation initiation factor IF-2 [Enterococcus mundtii CRL35]MDA9428575.1 Translation initiation factor 2 [Enterococcus mundtii 1A]MDK4210737.1 translation initiation factor IF-2 [Enterococcus mundtii]MDO7878008.1 translation initiation factor IF-2 [Enterococcus mundtii]